MSDASAFEQALTANPDDGTGWRAYADYLVEQDDPRGEFMQTQLALEQPSLPKEQRKKLQEREKELLRDHEAEWLGPELATHLLDDHAAHPNVGHWWGRGFLAELTVRRMTPELATALANAPVSHFLRSLRVETAGETRVPGTTRLSLQHTYSPLIGSPCLQNVRVFQIGDEPEQSADGRTNSQLFTLGLEELVASMPRIEEMYLMCSGYDARTLFGLPKLTNLQTLRIHGLGNDQHVDRYEVPLDALAKNASVGSLTHLFVHPEYTANVSYLPLSQVHALMHSPHLECLEHLQLRLSEMGDDGVRAIIESKKLRRLGWLDLRNGKISDLGAKAFAEYALTRNLRRLDLSRNWITAAGLSLLHRAGINAIVDTTLSRREAESREQQALFDDQADEEAETRREDDWE